MFFRFAPTDRIKDLVAKLHVLLCARAHVYERVDNYRANGTHRYGRPLYFTKAEHLRAILHAMFFLSLFFILFCAPYRTQIRAFFGDARREGPRIRFVAGCSALFAVLSWHFESVSDFMDYPENVFPWPFATRRSRFPRRCVAFNYDRGMPRSLVPGDLRANGGFDVY